MANHLRQQIREAVATQLSGLTTTSTRVYQSRLHPLSDSNLPCLLVSTEDEEVRAVGLHSQPLLERTVRLTVRGVAKAVSNVDDLLDTMAKEVETAIGTAADQTFGGLVKRIDLTGLRAEMDDGLEKPVGIVSIFYNVVYFCHAGAPTAAS